MIDTNRISNPTKFGTEILKQVLPNLQVHGINFFLDFLQFYYPELSVSNKLWKCSYPDRINQKLIFQMVSRSQIFTNYFFEESISHFVSKLEYSFCFQIINFMKIYSENSSLRDDHSLSLTNNPQIFTILLSKLGNLQGHSSLFNDICNLMHSEGVVVFNDSKLFRSYLLAAVKQNQYQKAEKAFFTYLSKNEKQPDTYLFDFMIKAYILDHKLTEAFQVLDLLLNKYSLAPTLHSFLPILSYLRDAKLKEQYDKLAILMQSYNLQPTGEE